MRAALRLRRGGFSWRKVGDRVVVLELETSRYFSLNPSASAIWIALQDGATIEELVAGLLEVFEVTTEQATADVESFLAQLRARGLLGN